jgi:hypothetical protein
VKPVAALVAITLSLLAGPLTGAAVAGPAPVAPSQVLPPVGGPLRLDLAQFGPRIVTAGGPDVLTLTGTLTNTGNQPVEDIEVRVQRGDPLTTEGQLRDALEGSANTDAVTPEFIPLAGELAPGGQVPIQLRVPLRGAPETGLALADTGVHQLLVNVNGVPRLPAPHVAATGPPHAGAHRTRPGGGGRAVHDALPGRRHAPATLHRSR